MFAIGFLSCALIFLIWRKMYPPAIEILSIVEDAHKGTIVRGPDQWDREKLKREYRKATGKNLADHLISQRDPTLLDKGNPGDLWTNRKTMKSFVLDRVDTIWVDRDNHQEKP